jgi:hypothetical protein
VKPEHGEGLRPGPRIVPTPVANLGADGVFYTTKTDREPLAVASRVITWLLLVFVLGFSLVRARSQAIAHDEALTYVSYIHGGFGQTLKFSPNNHVLFTWAAAMMTRLFGVTEFTLRLPSLAGLMIYLISCYLLCRRLFGSGIVLVLTCALLVTNPLLLDFSVAARGYGLGLSLLMLAAVMFADLTGLDRAGSPPDRWELKCAVASVCLGLAVVANFSYLLPAVSFAVVFTAITVGKLRTSGGSYGRRLTRIGRWVVIPGSVVGVVILWHYLIQARSSAFQFGYGKLTVFMREAMDSSLLYKWTDETYANLGTHPLVAHSWQHLVSTWLSFVVLPLLTLSIVVGFVVSLRKSPFADRSSHRTWCQLFCGTTIGCLCLLVFLHLIFLGDYPVVRGCLYLIPLYTLSTALVTRQFGSNAAPVVRLLGLLAAIVITADYVGSLQMSTFRYNVYDAHSREAFTSVVKDAREKGLKDVQMGGTWWYEPELNFYRLRYQANQMRAYQVLNVASPFVSLNLQKVADYDYLCLTAENKLDVENQGWRVVFRDDTTGITIAAIDR